MPWWSAVYRTIHTARGPRMPSSKRLNRGLNHCSSMRGSHVTSLAAVSYYIVDCSVLCIIRLTSRTGSPPILGPLSDTSIADLPKLPPQEYTSRLFNTILFLHVTTSKQYSARTRAFVFSFATVDERAIVETIKNPDHAVEQAQRKTEHAREREAQNGAMLRKVGMGLGAVAGGVLIGVTGGLAAPLVGAGVGTLLGFLGVGGTAAGLLATGLASSSVVCGALFGAYGARSTANMVERHTREVRDLAIVPVNPSKETLAVRLCVSGWLSTRDDVKAPWTIFGEDDTFALQWEVEALEQLSNALTTLVKAQAMKYVKAEIIKRTVLASLMSSLAPLAWLKIGQIIDNPWMNAKALVVKAGAVLGDLLASHVLGNRPVTLVGYSLGSLVIFEALKHLASLPPSLTAHIIQDVFLFGLPAPCDEGTWSSVRRVVAGRLVNGYSEEDYVLAVLSRASDARWHVAGLQPVAVQGVENLNCDDVEGHLQWRGKIGSCLARCEAPGIINAEVETQMRKAGKDIEAVMKEMEMGEEEAECVIKEGPTAPN
ncbi:hypothetical protein JAAARDRAFT_173479 [Jaapia argillacea MUCL 33604]|uniref:DUF726-domain-containing protein n=1 Tax=Jaapia argillacea MUCL 33604 TaxID=933084 RepID=A0A067QEJ3_9AGAM|nr:hypothetical protein JAAARDRAFT_173479 [Jaapia argillacea MUCL 33604]